MPTRVGDGLAAGARIARIQDVQPVPAVRGQRDARGAVLERRQARPAEHLDRHALEACPHLRGLDGGRQVGDHQHRVVEVLPREGEDPPVAGLDELDGAAAEGRMRLPHGDHPPRPVQQRGRRAFLRLDVDGLEAEHRVHHQRRAQALRIRAREAAVAIPGPLHRRPHAMPIRQVDVVAHADLVAVVDDRRARQRQQQHVEQFDPSPVAIEQRRQSTTDADVDAHARILGEGAVHVLALFRRDHLQRQLVVVAQEQRPLAALGDVGRLAQDLDDRLAVLPLDRHVEAGHQREVERHVALVTGAEVLADVGRPLVGLGQQDAPRILGVHEAAHLLDERVGLRQALARGAFPLDEVRDRVESEGVHPQVEPEPHDAQHRPHHPRVLEVQVGLVVEEAVPVVGVGDRIPRPVRRLGVREDDPRAVVLAVAVAPHVEVARRRPRRGLACLLEPGMLVRGVVHHQLGDHPEVARMRLAEEAPHVAQRAVRRMHTLVVRDVVAIVAQRRRVERQDPDRVDAQRLEIVELPDQPREVTDAVVVAVEEGADMHLIDDGVLVPVGLCRA